MATAMTAAHKAAQQAALKSSALAKIDALVAKVAGGDTSAATLERLREALQAANIELSQSVSVADLVSKARWARQKLAAEVARYQQRTTPRPAAKAAPRLSEAKREQIRTRLQRHTLAEWRDGMSEAERSHLREALSDRGLMYENYERYLPAGVRNALAGESRRRQASSGRHVSYREIIGELVASRKR